MLIPIVMLIGGLILLVLAADWLVDGSVGFARRIGVPPLVVGLTIVDRSSKVLKNIERLQS